MASRQSRQQPTTSAPAASRTQTETTTPSQDQPPLQDPTLEGRPQPAILRLRGVRASSGPSVRWAEGVVDNEGLGRKSSKVCCIYHPTKPVGESSDESSSDSSSGSDDSGTDSDDSTRGKGKRKHRSGGSGGGGKKHEGDCHGHNHDHDHDGSGGGSGARKKKKKRTPSPNAYEKMPKVKPRAAAPDGGGAPGASGQ
ncbi:hypothetical protein PspLS_03140 [Pyricularia sp. CBS 133598]|nr:hypothetical protein PspLS_03140 [Pyricularia sp. CBS 133598]